jgi:hypothetical protein
MNIKHLNDSEVVSFISGGLDYSNDILKDIIDDLVNRLEQCEKDNQDAIDDISNHFEEFESAYATVSHDIDNELTKEYRHELKQLKEIIMEGDE